MANLSTLVTTTCFRTADGEFHGFEGFNDHRGCCFGNCTHVWNYETATAHLFPTFSPLPARSRFRLLAWTSAAACISASFCPTESNAPATPPPTARWARSSRPISTGSFPAITAWLREFWPEVKTRARIRLDPRRLGRRIATASWKACSTTPTTWSSTDPIRCAASTIWAHCAPAKRWRAPWAIRQSADEYRSLFDNGSQWIDANLFNGEYYIQKIQRHAPRRDRAGTAQRHGRGRSRTSRLPSGRWLPCRSIDGPVSGRRRRPRAAARSRQHSQDARIHLPLQLQARTCTITIACSAPTR